MTTRRIPSLDYLRGVMAISVMVYHYVVWSGVELSNDSILGKLGIYAVSIFYILSGLSLSIVYRGRISSGKNIGEFLIKRVFRIAPLFWISVSSALSIEFISAFLKNQNYSIDIYKVFLNYSLLFGFLDPAAYLSTGAWSIGNEIVFYVLLPILFFLSLKKPWVIAIAIAISLIFYLFFATLMMDESRSLADQWDVYINPLNQIFLFLGGVAIAAYAKPVAGRSVTGVVVITAFFIFWLYPVGGDRLQLVINFGRVIFSMACFAFVWAAYASNARLSGYMDRIMLFFGESCYSIYLMHPLVATVVVFVTSRMGISLPWGYTLAAIMTLGVSWVTFRYVEKPMMRIGASVSRSFGTQTRQLA
jgi:exopolysaccharide production protein ExoZ